MTCPNCKPGRRCRECRWDDGAPTPEQIREACLEIQAGWSEGEEARRRAPVRPVDIAIVSSLVEEPGE